MGLRGKGPSKVSGNSQLANQISRNAVLVDRIKGLQRELQMERDRHKQLTDRAQTARIQLQNLVEAAARNMLNSSQDWDNRTNGQVYNEITRIMAEVARNIHLRGGLGIQVDSDFEREVRAMFSQQHYTVLADLIKAERRKNDNDRVHGKPELAAKATIRDEQLSDFQLALIKHLEDDNPKFKTFKFIEACSTHGQS